MKNYVISIENDGFTTKIVSSKFNENPVIFKSASGESMTELLTKIHSVSIQPSNCNEDDGVGLAIRGIDMRMQSKTYGAEVILFVASVAEK